MSSDTVNNIVFGSTEHGFVPRQLADIQRSINEKLALIVDPKTGEYPFQNSSDDTVLQQVTAIFAEAVANVENAAATAFRMRDPLTAVGAGESALVQLNVILRRPGSYTIIPVMLTGTPSTLIPAGSQISSTDLQTIFELVEDVVLPQGGTAMTRAKCRELGPFNPNPDTVTYIITPVSGWSSVTNRQINGDGDGANMGGATSIGTAQETDEELRRRQQLSTNATSYRQIEAIRAAAANIPGVSFVRAYQNRTLETDDRDLPGKSLACVVVGGDDRAIADAILFRAPEGMEFYGNTSVTIYDSMGIGTVVAFSRPLERKISLAVNLEVVVDEGIQAFPTNGEQLIKEAILDFVKNGSSLCEPLGNSGFVPGQDIIRSYLYTPINSIGGTRIKSLQLAVDDGAFSEQDIAIAWNEIGIFDSNRIWVDFP